MHLHALSSLIAQSAHLTFFFFFSSLLPFLFLFSPFLLNAHILFLFYILLLLFVFSSLLFSSLHPFKSLILSFYFSYTRRHLSPVCMDFMRKLLVKDPNLRMSTGQALRHPFITGQVTLDTSLIFLFPLLFLFSLFSLPRISS